MSTFDVGVWLTSELYHNGPGDPSTALDKFITNAFDEAGHTVNLDIHAANPDPPNENIVGQGWPADDTMRCDGHIGTVTYDSLDEWWNDWHYCNADYTHDDATLLVTNYDSDYGVTTGTCSDSRSHLCVAEAHRCGELANEPTDAEGSEKRYAQMYASVIHELGHAAINEHLSAKCGSSPLAEEQMARSWYETSSGPARCTPMVSWDNSDGSVNECCADLVENPYGTGTEIYWQPTYSTCTANHMKSCSDR